jgi:hypothetical protein
MDKRWMSLLAAGVIAGLALTGFSQRPGRSGKVQPVFVQSADGSVSRGWVKKDRGKSVFIDSKGKTSDLAEDAKLTTIPQMEREFKKYQQSLLMQDLKDYERVVRLMEWAKTHQFYEAIVEYGEKFRRLNLANPNPEIENLLKEAQDKLVEFKAPPSEGGGSAWSVEDVQKVRFAFLPVKGPTENLPVAFKNNLLRRFLDDMASTGKMVTPEDQRKFNALRPGEKAQIIKLETGDKYQADIVINRDPQAILDFRKVVVPFLARSCANSNCHGGTTLPFKLVTRATALPDLYANFYSLDTFRTDKGDVINHDQPEKSLLLIFLLPRDSAGDKLAHPTQIVPQMKSKHDPRFTQLVRWLKSLPPKPIDEITGQAPTSQPAEGAPAAENSETPGKTKRP